MMTHKNNSHTISANFLVVFNTGVLLRGKESTGKTDTSLALLDRGHQLVADDSVILTLKENQLIGTCPSAGKGFLYVSNIGIISVEKTFSIKQLKDSHPVDLVIDFTEATPQILLEPAKTCDLFGVKIDQYELATPHPRPVALLIETAVKCFLLQKKGYNGSDELQEQQHNSQLMDKNF